MKTYKVIGLMSGTSLDGLDIAYCEFRKLGKNWKYVIKEAKTVAYDEKRKNFLSGLMNVSAEEISHANAAFGKFTGEQVVKFIKATGSKPSLVCSHGHTIFHQPSKGFTVQIGSGASIFAETRIPVVCDFRSVDVSFKGQGAPLVPIGDKLLFSQYDYCLNLGGISNISFDAKGKRIAYDISPANIVLNYLAGLKGLPYDKNGKLSSTGKVNETLLSKLNELDYYKKSYPKSLGKEWVDDKVFPIINANEISVEDKLATFVEHISMQIANTIKGNLTRTSGKSRTMLVTGGGAFNGFLIKRMEEHLKGYCEVVVPDKNTIMFKEALIFAFLGVLRVRNEINALRSVTGAEMDTVGGAYYGPINASFLS